MADPVGPSPGSRAQPACITSTTKHVEECLDSLACVLPPTLLSSLLVLFSPMRWLHVLQAHPEALMTKQHLFEVPLLLGPLLGQPSLALGFRAPALS